MREFDLGIDGRMLRHTGIGTYLSGLLKGLSEVYPALPVSAALFGAEEPVYPENFAHPAFKAPIYSVKEQLIYPGLLSRCRLWHAPHYNVPLLKRGTGLVVTVHDLIHWIFRRQFFGPHQAAYAGLMLNRTVRTADHIITVSENTKKDLIHHFGANPEKLSVIYEAVDETFRPASADQIAELLARYGIQGPYFLYVGSLKPHKNLLWLLPVFRRLRAEGKIRAKLVILGKKDLKYRAGYEALGKIETDGDIHYLPSVASGELPTLYSGAIALVHPSLYEGFGLTPLEAMACGTAVIAARNASIPEICGEGACLVDSSGNHDIMQAIIQAENDPTFRRQLQERGKNRVTRYSWQETARKTLEVYQKVLVAS